MTGIVDARTLPHRRGAQLALAALLGAWAFSSPLAAQESKVAIDNFAFTPNVLTVKSGSKVVFENRDDIPHLVVAANGSFRSKAMDTNDSFTVTFDHPGAFAYFCGLHPQMQGKIIVSP